MTMMIEVMTRVIVVVTIVAVIVDMMMMIKATAIVRATTVKTMIANIVAMTRANPLVIKKMKMQILKMMSKLTSGVTLLVANID